MKTVCAWCASVISLGDDSNNLLTSHGICAPCRAILVTDEAQGQSLQAFIDTIPVPIVVLDGSLSPVCTNKSGRETFHLLDEELTHFTLGEVVECDNARLPEGCGRTVHCSGCVLRKTVTDTYATGHQVSMVPATLKAGDQNISCYVSAVKVGDCVVVKLDS